MNKKHPITEQLKNEVLNLRSKGICRKSILDTLKISLEQYSKIIYRRKPQKRTRAKKSPREYKLSRIHKEYHHSLYPVLESKVEKFKIKKGASFPTQNFSAKDVINKFGPEIKCFYSGELINLNNYSDYALDHKLPPFRGGTNEIDNLVICKSFINSMKYTLNTEEFIAACIRVARFSS